MKPIYKNWIPASMLVALYSGSAVALVVAVIVGVLNASMIAAIILGIVAAFLLGYGAYMNYMYCKFSYNGKSKMQKVIIDGIARYVNLKDGKVLDVGCGCGALGIAVAKRNPNVTVVGLDRWGKEYASFTKPLCESNAKAEGVKNIEFVQGNAVKLDYPDESFDGLVSNYVYHNISGVNKQAILTENLRVLKKGGTFAIHDIMSKARYGDMEAFAENLRKQGYKKVELIKTDKGLFFNGKELWALSLAGSMLLYGEK